MNKKEYKVIKQSDKLLGGKFSTDKLEVTLNDMANDGWHVISITNQDFPMGFGGRIRQEIVVVLERDK